MGRLNEDSARQIADLVKSYVGEAFESVQRRIDSLPTIDWPEVEAVITSKLVAALEKREIPQDGKDGRDGIDGKDGAAGLDGKDGAPGLDGKDGIDGAAGKDGRDGIDGKDGAPGRDGKDGRDGRNGRDGDAGIPGRDALEIEPLNGLNEDASYQRGTYVTHRGGTLRAFRATDPVKGGDLIAAGWQVTSNGIYEQRLEASGDGRTLILSTEYTDGRTTVSKVKTHTPLHRGIYRREVVYERGDTCTWGGNCWHANRTTSEEPSNEAKDWSLMVRKGRDGKDLTEKGVTNGA